MNTLKNMVNTQKNVFSLLSCFPHGKNDAFILHLKPKWTFNLNLNPASTFKPKP